MKLTKIAVVALATTLAAGPVLADLVFPGLHYRFLCFCKVSFGRQLAPSPGRGNETTSFVEQKLP